MGAGNWANNPLDAETLACLRECLDRHPVSFAMVFGSVARDEARNGSDIDLAIEFESLRPEDDGYSDAYLRLRSDLDERLPVEIDVVDVHSLPPSFGRVVFEDGTVVLGSDERRAELEREVAGEQPSVSDARSRVAAAARRLREGADADRGEP
ncbi:type VII toxin-antitoxin system MntA family adenylyltransferase antitoxin [Halosimplex sp. TS25]|uniref:type VII toxin-antitoxin system MntA family adenylyltransferase antitoxin n=1 Tax=Halosimplex rarum TaxID=3396619 RepID=UPI0039E7D1A6